jgi:fatty acid desaturase
MNPAANDLLNPQQRAMVRRRSSAWGVSLVCHAWAMIGASMALFVYAPNPITYVLAVMLIGSRQLGLLILMHDGAHGLLAANRPLNEFLSQFLCAFPTLADTHIYRRYHLKHHARTLQDDDPDIVLTGHYPVTRQSLKRKFIRDLTGRTGIYQRRDQLKQAWGPRELSCAAHLKRFGRALGAQIGANLVLLVGLSVAGYWYLYPLLWLLPLLTWQQLVLRIRNIAEHAVVADRNNPFKNARTTLANPLERLFVAPYYVNYHLEHHLLMWVPCYRLPLFRRYLLDNGYGDRMETTRGYLSVLQQVTYDDPADQGRTSGKPRAGGTFSDGFN